MLGTPESERSKVTALNLFYPTTSPLPKELVSSYVTQPLGGEGKGEGALLNKGEKEKEHGKQVGR